MMEKNNPSETKKIQWQDIANNGSGESFAEINRINLNSLSLVEGEVTILPNNTLLPHYEKPINLYASSIKNVVAYMKDNGIFVHIYSDEKIKRELVLKSADIVLPLLLFVGNSIVTIGLSLLSRYIYDRLVKKSSGENPVIKVEYAQLDENGRICRWRKIEGPANEIQRLLLEESAIIADESNKSGKMDSRVSPRVVRKNDPDPYGKEEAKEALENAHNLFQEATNSKDKQVTENKLRESLIKIREAYLWEPENKHRIFLHQVGRKIHDMFKCQVEFKEGNYFVKCPCTTIPF
jgi:hypothetical protein